MVCDPGSKLQPVSLPAALTLLLQTSTTTYISNAMCRYCIMSVFVLHCTALDNKRLYTLRLRYCCRVEICRICSSSSVLLGGPQVLVGRGMNSHISSEQRSCRLLDQTSGKTSALDLGQISIKASREIGKILGHASSLSWKG